MKHLQCFWFKRIKNFNGGVFYWLIMQAITITCFNWCCIYILSAQWIIPSTRWLGNKKKSSQLDLWLNAQLLYSYFCYYKQNLEDLTVQSTGIENLKPQFRTGPATSAPSPRNGVEEETESSQNQIFCTCIRFMVWSYKQ